MQNRSHFSDYTVLSEVKFVDQKGKTQESQYVLIISNWHFIREHQDKRESPPCKPEDCNISIKLSSTTFKTGSADLSITGANYLDPLPDDGFSFDRNGVIIPYSSFLSLMEDKYFLNDYLPDVQREYERLCGPLDLTRETTPIPSHDPFADGGEEGEEEEEEEEEERPVKQVKKSGKVSKGKKTGGKERRGKIAVRPDTNDDDDVDYNADDNAVANDEHDNIKGEKRKADGDGVDANSDDDDREEPAALPQQGSGAKRTRTTK